MSINIERFELPEWYDDNLMTLLVVNQHSIYLYWEMCFEQWKILDGNQLVVNLYELNSDGVDPGNRLVRRHTLPPFTGDWYFHNLQPGRRYQAEICCQQNDRQLSIMKSNIVAVPPAGPYQGLREVEWRSVDGIGDMGTPAKAPAETMKELVNTMSFYMGIK
ncbi:hypothetical protein SAMN05660649_04412 [Desulfotomaculum arcticum]|uniref:DUF4912 domain-containing protein n=1 Tax=Desulfotruncus arcticus DSM 17038 TaxID=1121424 RepID=A0A1I2YH02_9FIRM|nr:DUF4912 domain-containing protein [Desulfotruncus arcticus]SFH24878.1 hypothetical protein SAMN05660649_04412 [Desulfotomaculum arcticum] [Desulfotruncus arcticus DSM 17038]